MMFLKLARCVSSIAFCLLIPVAVHSASPVDTQTNSQPVRDELGVKIAAGDSKSPLMQAAETKPLEQLPHAIITVPIYGEPNPADTNYFYVGLLELALTKTVPRYGTFDIQQLHTYIGTERLRLMLASDQELDVIWSTSNRQREELLRAVPVNLLRGLNEYRVLLVTDENASRFTEVKSLNDLKRIKVGSGDHWQDTLVLKHNELPVVGFWDYETMIPMLKAGRFDYVSRGMHEVWREIKYNDGVQVAQDVMLYYQLPVHYFVNKKNDKLANRILEGLKLAIEDGSYYDLFFAVPSHRMGYDRLQEMEAIVIELENPTATDKPEMITP